MFHTVVSPFVVSIGKVSQIATHRSPPASATKTSFEGRGTSPCQTHRGLPQKFHNAKNETSITFYRTDTTQPTKSQAQYHLNLIGVQKTDWGTEDYVDITTAPNAINMKSKKQSN